MPTRRHLLQAACLTGAWASGIPNAALAQATAPTSSRRAMVIGNSAYRQAPLANPGNDAQAVARLFEQAGLDVGLYLNASRSVMLAAMQDFAAAIQAPEVQHVIFYYAGHGVQLNWRNYLLPVDVEVRSEAHVHERCIDLGALLGQFGAVSGKTYIIVLDACRNNPFGGAWIPPQAGLSQFDAPPGSLLAYATAPGNVASDGQGQNGLYTENLVRELSRPDVRLEDALKRVRLNVRLASGGAQVPWETTSLEQDVYLFPGERKKKTAAEVENELERDMQAWGKTKGSTNPAILTAYLQEFPNGHFAEIAQNRIALLMPGRTHSSTLNPPQTAAQTLANTDTETPAGDPAAEPTSAATDTTTTAPQPAGPAIVIRPGSGLPPGWTYSDNPYSAGRYPLGRIWTVGDVYEYQPIDILTSIQRQRTEFRVTNIDLAADRVELNDGSSIVDLMGNPLKVNQSLFEVPPQLTPAVLQIGAKWRTGFAFTHPEAGRIKAVYEMHIPAFEEITVPAGTFRAFRIDGRGWNSHGSTLESHAWVIPGVNAVIRRESITRSASGHFLVSDRNDLCAMTQQTSSPELHG